MKTQHQKLKPQPRPFFSCGFFCHCAQSTLSPTTPHTPSLALNQSDPQPATSPPPPPPPPPPPQHPKQRPESSSSSSSTSQSQSFTQWKFPVHPHDQPPIPHSPPDPLPLPPPIPFTNVQELFHVAELQLITGSDSDQLGALHLLERSLVPDPPSDPVCPEKLMRGVVGNLKNKAGAKPATKVLLALCLAVSNRRVAVEAGAVGAVVEAATELEGAAAERSLAALELMCTVAEGAAEVRGHALAVPAMVAAMTRTGGRGREYAISVLAVIYGGDVEEAGTVGAPPEEVARAVVLALQGESTARGRRKGAQLLKLLRACGRLDYLAHDATNE